MLDATLKEVWQVLVILMLRHELGYAVAGLRIDRCAVPISSAQRWGSDHQIDPVSQSGQNLGSLDIAAEIWGNLGDFGCYIISFFGKKLGSLDGTYIGIYRGPVATLAPH